MLGTLLLAGCTGRTTCEVKGKVSFNGKPVPRGRIYFNPDFTKDNDGPQGYADIRDGAFDTHKGGKGACGGPTIVVIQGYDGVDPANPDSVGSPLFAEYQQPIDLPKEACERSFDVPLSAAEDMPKRTRRGKGP